MSKKLKIANLGDWHLRGGGHLYVCGYSQKDMIELLERARCKVEGREYSPDFHFLSLNYLRVYGSMNCWGTPMNGVEQERGVWWQKNYSDKPERII